MRGCDLASERDWAVTMKILVVGIVCIVLSSCASNESDAVPIPADPPADAPSVVLTADSSLTETGPRATGTFWYRAEQRMLGWVARAEPLPPLRHYRVELSVDGTANYAIASVRTDEAGRLAGSGLLTAFSDRACVGDNADAPRALVGHHQFRVAIKDDGAPNVGLLGGDSPTSTSLRLPCSGNGDNQFTYRLIQRQTASVEF